MDIPTIIIVLCGHLLCMGMVMYFIGSLLPDSHGIRSIATGAVLLGLGYGIQLLDGPRMQQPWAAALRDTLVAVSPLFFLLGFGRFFRLVTFRVHTIALLGGLYAVLSWLAISLGGQQARFVWLNAWASVVYLSIAVLTLRQAVWGERLYRAGALLIGALSLVVGSLQSFKAWQIATVGAQAAALHGLTQKIFYGFASFTAVVMTPTVVGLVFLRLNQQLQRIAIYDPLTQVFNRTGAELVLRRHFGRRPPAPMTMLLIDLDHFKRVNDEYGHLAGDAVLKTLGELLAGSVREGDFAARLGGEEFVVGCTDADPQTVALLAERLRSAIAQARTPVQAGPKEGICCTASIGVSCPMHGVDEWERALREADVALYEAKRQGRNRVVFTECSATKEP